MFEIGAGSGQHTQIILESLSKNKIIDYTGIDVSEKQRELFIERSKSFNDNVKVNEYTIAPWQEYIVKNKYDVVLSQHSWYGIGEAARNFEKIKDVLADDGVCFVVLNSRLNLSLIAMDNGGLRVLSSEDFELGAINAGLKLERIRSYNHDNPRGVFYGDGKLTQHGLDHFSYLYRKDLKGDEQNVIDMLISAPDESFLFPTDLLVIRK